MNAKTLFLGICYEVAVEIAKSRPRLKSTSWFPLVLSTLKPYWIEWKTFLTMERVDEQAGNLVKQWEKEDKEAVSTELSKKAEKLFLEATVTPLPNAVVPSVIIIHEAGKEASDDVKALGGELRITSKIGLDSITFPGV